MNRDPSRIPFLSHHLPMDKYERLMFEKEWHMSNDMGGIKPTEIHLDEERVEEMPVKRFTEEELNDERARLLQLLEEAAYKEVTVYREERLQRIRELKSVVTNRKHLSQVESQELLIAIMTEAQGDYHVHQLLTSVFQEIEKDHVTLMQSLKKVPINVLEQIAKEYL